MKYIYSIGRGFRVKIRWDVDYHRFHFQLQRKGWFGLFVDISGKWLTCEEEDNGWTRYSHNIYNCDHYTSGQECRTYKKDTMYLNVIASEMLTNYFREKIHHHQMKRKLK